MNSQPVVHVVDDDPQMRESLALLSRSAGLDAIAYVSAEEFLSRYLDDARTPCCLVLDLCMPGLGGLGLQRELAAMGVEMPVIMISGFADVPAVVQAMNAGALDFVEKPFSHQALLTRILGALDRSAEIRQRQARRSEVAARLSALSAREREVLDRLVAGRHAKHIAAEFGIGEKTVLKHRSRIMEKLHVDSIAELVHLALTLEELSAVPGTEARVG